MKVLVQYSGGKDSQACLLWASNKYGSKNVRAVFCDTYWDADTTVKHIKETTKALGVELKIITSKFYTSFEDMVVKKGVFPSAMRRFCTSELKVKPFVDYLLEEVKEHVIIIQGIRALESKKRSLMSKQCTYFKHYFEPYTVNKRGDKVYFNYRKKEVKKWLEKYDESLYRPVFDWTGQEVIDYIQDNGQKPNILYYEGFKRVGCFPCVMTSMQELKQIITRYPQKKAEIIEMEQRLNTRFFPYDYIPERFRTGIRYYKDGRTKPASTASDVFEYVQSKYLKPDLFGDNDTPSCSSFYHLCE